MAANPSLGTIQRDEKSLPEKCRRRNWSELGSRRGLVKAVGWCIGATEEVWCGQARKGGEAARDETGEETGVKPSRVL